MKNLRFVLVALTVLLMATAAQAQQTRVKANVPFDFVAGDRYYPAGEYSLQSVHGIDSFIQIANTQEDRATNVASNACSATQPSAQTKLVFRRIGGSYFLSQIWTAGSSLGREFPKSRAELRLAQNREKPELVIVAANI